jgi:effector-binding domain-containing protein
MIVDFSLTRVPRYRVASIVKVGPWREENLRTEFTELRRWAERHRIRTGRWIFVHPGGNRWEACLEIKGRAPAEGRIRLRTLAAGWAACVTFDPELVSSRVVYHALHDWTRERRREGEIRSVGGAREVYAASPWADRRAWRSCRVEFLVRR